jgi:hypothetical protein
MYIASAELAAREWPAKPSRLRRQTNAAMFAILKDLSALSSRSQRLPSLPIFQKKNISLVEATTIVQNAAIDLLV